MAPAGVVAVLVQPGVELGGGHDDQLTEHRRVADAAVLRAEDRELSSGVGDEIDRDAPAAFDLLRYPESPHTEAVDAVHAEQRTIVLAIDVSRAGGLDAVSRIVTAVAGKGRASIAWSAPASNGGRKITGYTVTSSPGGKNCSTTGSSR